MFQIRRTKVEIMKILLKSYTIPFISVVLINLATHTIKRYKKILQIMTIFLLMFFIGQSDAQTVVYNIPQGQTINQGNAACGSGAIIVLVETGAFNGLLLLRQQTDVLIRFPISLRSKERNPIQGVFKPIVPHDIGYYNKYLEVLPYLVRT
jgi:hypothetical protein